MIEELELETYLYISPSEFGIYLLDTHKLKNLYENKIKIKNEDNVINLIVLKDFLEDNIFKIEKLVGKFIKDIFLIIENEQVLNVNFCIKKKNYQQNINEKYLQNMLTDAKDLFKENYQKYKIIHMVINKFIVDGKMYSHLTEVNNYSEICLEIKFICLNKSIIENLKYILSKYQIIVRNIICFKYLKSFQDFSDRNSSIIAYKVLNGLNQNEIFFSNKKTKNVSFFEKFFSYFN